MRAFNNFPSKKGDVTYQCQPTTSININKIKICSNKSVEYFCKPSYIPGLLGTELLNRKHT